jgi:hypothetical protein
MCSGYLRNDIVSTQTKCVARQLRARTSEKPNAMATYILAWLVRLHGTYSSVCKLVFTLSASARALTPLSPISLLAKLRRRRNTNCKRQDSSSVDRATDHTKRRCVLDTFATIALVPKPSVWLVSYQRETECYGDVHTGMTCQASWYLLECPQTGVHLERLCQCAGAVVSDFVEMQAAALTKHQL